MLKKNSTVIKGGLIILILIILVSVLSFRLKVRQPLIGLSDKIKVSTSFYPLYFLASTIGGDKVDITNIVPSGAEPHDYEPTSQDMVKMESSRLIIINGGGLEVWGENIKNNINPRNTVIIMAGEGLTTQSISENGQASIDSHIWLNPLLAGKMVDKIVQVFEQVDPLNKNYYQSNANALKIKLGNLDEAYKKGLSTCQKKDIISSHAAFGYLATAYGFNQVSIAGLSPDAEPSPQQLADIVKFAKINQLKYIFFERLVSPKLAQTIATEVGAQTLVLNPLEGLSDQDISQGKNYLTLMQDNLINLEIALQCSK